MKYGKWIAAGFALCLLYGMVSAAPGIAADEISVEYGTEEEKVRKNTGEYLFYDVSSRFLTDREVNALTAQQACYAKNEVYAIHGRKFVSVELQEYFGSKSWYRGTVEPSRFTDRVFNRYELANIQALVRREEELCPGGYPLDQKGYDISLAGTASGNAVSAGTPQKREAVNQQSIDDICIYNYIPEESSIILDEFSHSYYVNDEIIIFFSMDATSSEKEQVFNYLNGELAGGSPELNMYQVMLTEKKSLEELSLIADDLAVNFDGVLFATYDTVTSDPEDAYPPNDPWNHDVSEKDWTDADVDGSNWWAEAIDCQGAWDYRDEYSKIKIGINDSSFDIGHEDLKNRVSFPNDVLEYRNNVTPWYISIDNLRDLNKWNVSEQLNCHGTQVAGIIGAGGDNRKGITGIVQNCDILLAPLYACDKMEGYLALDSSIYANLAYLVKAGAKVINFSQGKTGFLTMENGKASHYDEAVIKREGNLASIAISQLIRSGYKDFLVVQSAGNGIGKTGIAVDAIQNGWFASITADSITGSKDILIDEILSHVIIVGAAEQTSTDYRCAPFSNYGTQVDLVAPGTKIYSTIPGEVFRYEFSGGYGFARGTSYAAPMVTGVCSLVWSINPGLNNCQVKDIVCTSYNTEVHSHPDTQDNLTYNMVNARLSVEAARSYSTNSDSLNDDHPDSPSENNSENKSTVYLISTSMDRFMTMTYAYYANGLLKTRSDSDYSYLYNYDNNNRLAMISRKNGGQEDFIITFSYDSENRVSARKVKSANGKMGENRVFHYNDEDQIIKIVIDGFNNEYEYSEVYSYSYDKDGRIAEFRTDDDWRGVYSYDLRGNISSYHVTENNQTNYFDNYNQYDENGNLISQEPDFRQWEYEAMDIDESMIELVKEQQKYIVQDFYGVFIFN